MGATGDQSDGAAAGRGTRRAVVAAVGVVLVAANALLVLAAVLGVPPIGVLGLGPVLVLDVVAVAVLVALTASRGRPPASDTLLPRRYPVAARAASGLLVVWAVASVVGDSFVALLAAPAGVFALVMALFPTAAVWWRWCARAAAVSVLAWPAPVLVGMRLDRDAVEGWGVGFGSLVTMLLVGITVVLAAAAAVGYAVARSGSAATAAREVAAGPS